MFSLRSQSRALARAAFRHFGDVAALRVRGICGIKKCCGTNEAAGPEAAGPGDSSEGLEKSKLPPCRQYAAS